MARRGALPRHAPQQRHPPMGSPIAARRGHNAHIQGILQRLFRRIPQTGRQQAIRPVQPVQRDRATPAQRGVRRHTARPDRITRQMVDEWYVNARDELTAWTFEQAARTLKRVMLAAATEQADGTPPLIPASPCRYRVIKPQSKRRDQPPVTACM